MVLRPTKSVSILYGLGDPATGRAVLAAHHAGLAEAVAYLDEHLGARREQVGGPGGQRVQLLGGQVVVVDRLRRDVRAHEHGLDAELFYDVELRLGAAQVALEGRGRDGLEVAERLVEVERETELPGAPPDRLGRVRRCDQVGLEDLDSVEARFMRGDDFR